MKLTKHHWKELGFYDTTRSVRGSVRIGKQYSHQGLHLTLNADNFKSLAKLTEFIFQYQYSKGKRSVISSIKNALELT